MIIISSKQKGNNVINFLTYSSFTYSDNICTDYEINNNISILFLSLRFHCCKPEYIFKRINKLKPYSLSILLIFIDTKNYLDSLLELQDRIQNLTIILGFSNEECARYLKAFDINQNRSINVLRKKEHKFDTFLESFPKINTSDTACIIEKYKTLKDFFNDIDTNVKNVKGIGQIKIKYLKEFFEKPFK